MGLVGENFGGDLTTRLPGSSAIGHNRYSTQGKPALRNIQPIFADLAQSGFAERFRAKGRFEKLMSSIPVKIITHPQPGLFGAAAAFAKEHLS